MDTDTLEKKVMCPFHFDKNPSMKINLYDGTFFCFGCEATGDALQFVKLANPRLNDLQAMIKLIRITKSKQVRNIKLKHRSEKKKEVKQSLIEAKDYYFGLSKVDWKTTEDIEALRCLSYMESRGFNEDILNWCKAKVNINRVYPIIFPIMDNGEFKGWVCRTNNKRVEKRRKYLYNEGFSRKTTLAGNYSGVKTVVLCEGYMDMLKLRMFGYKKVAAVLGWKVSDEQVIKLKNEGVQTIISALDNDECGIKGTEYLKNFFNVVRFQYPKGIKDAGEMDKKTFEIADKRTLMEYRKWKETQIKKRKGY